MSHLSEPEMEIFGLLLAAWPAAMRELSPRGADGKIAELVADAERKMEGRMAKASAEHKCALRAGMWLLADDLDRAHKICQDIATPYGSAWHAVMHRREGDFSNALYWWRLARDVRWDGAGESDPPRARHGVADAVRGVLVKMRDGGVVVPTAVMWEKELEMRGYDPSRFVELVEAAERESGAGGWRDVLVAVQRVEWMGLFMECVKEGGRH